MRVRTGLCAVLLTAAAAFEAGCQSASRESALVRLEAALPRDSTQNQISGDTCMRVHQLWRDEVRVALRAARYSGERRASAFLEAVYRPEVSFWRSYVGNERNFVKRVVRRWTELGTDPRTVVPLENDLADLIVKTKERASVLGQRPVPCTDWYLVYGPGWANLGSSGVGMFIDFFGLPADHPAQDIRNALPHEMAHLIFARTHEDDPDQGTLLHRIVEEGFVSYFSTVYSEGMLTDARSLGYSEAEWDWAIQHERQLWQQALPKLTSRKREDIFPFQAAGQHVLRGAPGKIGYFLGYRITQSYVARYGPDAWREVFDLPLATILKRSGYAR